MTIGNSDQKPLTKEEVIQVLRSVNDPDLQINIIDLGLVYDVVVRENNSVYIQMTLTTPACPYGPELVASVKAMLLMLKDVKDVTVDMVFDPPWSMDKLSEEAKLELGLDL